MKNENPAIVINVSKGKDYLWCACGRSQQQPFCDGSHTATDIKPVKFTATKNQFVYFCGCKKTHNAPLCDGSHIPN